MHVCIYDIRGDCLCSYMHEGKELKNSLCTVFEFDAHFLQWDDSVSTGTFYPTVMTFQPSISSIGHNQCIIECMFWWYYHPMLLRIHEHSIWSCFSITQVLSSGQFDRYSKRLSRWNTNISLNWPINQTISTCYYHEWVYFWFITKDNIHVCI